MEKMTDIAKDYLADFDVLTEARKELEEQLDNWWRILLPKYVLPVLQKSNNGIPVDFWDNKSNPGLCHYRAIKDQPILLQLTDPRSSQRGCYTATLFVQSQPNLKKMRENEPLMKRLNSRAIELEVGDASGLRWVCTELAKEDIPIDTENPEETAQRVIKTCESFFSLIVEHNRFSLNPES